MKCSAFVIVCFLGGVIGAIGPAAAGDSAAASKAVVRDGQHDFDFNLGVWKTHIRRVLDPLSGSTQSIELNGTVTVRKVWDGRAQLEEIEAQGPNGPWEGLTLFLYNPQAHQWSLTTFSDLHVQLPLPFRAPHEVTGCDHAQSDKADDQAGQRVDIRAHAQLHLRIDHHRQGAGTRSGNKA